jgi:ring-1,2-phenylacetyl-CoA epoxidase subunit PaaC
MMEAALTTDVRTAVRDLTLVLADSKRLLGTRYAGWMLGAPELEGGIALSSMAQDEWGHGRLLYALMKDFDEDPDALEHAREPAAYCSIEALDTAPDAWPALVAVNALVDGALTVQLEALRASRWLPLRQRVEKMLDEETFHTAHAAAWVRWHARTGEAARHALRAAVADIAPAVLRWFGPDGDRARLLVDAGVVDAAGSTLRERFIERLHPLLALADAADVLEASPDFAGFDEARRRTAGTAPDEETIRRVRGDRNRAFRMD